mgnify:CR=1 FL=1
MEGVSAEIIVTLVNKMDQVCAAVTNMEKEVTRVREELKEEIATVRSELKEEIATVRSELKEEIATVRSELKNDMATMEVNLKNEIKFQIEKSNSELSDYMVNDIIPILNNLDSRMRVLESRNNNGTIGVAEDSALYETDSKND